MNTNWEVFMILLCRNAVWGKICFLLILQVSPQMTPRFLMKSKPKAMSVIGLYPKTLQLLQSWCSWEINCQALENSTRMRVEKSISFLDVQQYREKHGVGCWWHLSLRTLVRHEGRRGVILAGDCHFNRQAFLVCRGSFIGAKSSGYCSRRSSHGAMQCLTAWGWRVEAVLFDLSNLHDGTHSAYTSCSFARLHAPGGASVSS